MWIVKLKCGDNGFVGRPRCQTSKPVRLVQADYCRCSKFAHQRPTSLLYQAPSLCTNEIRLFADIPIPIKVLYLVGRRRRILFVQIFKQFLQVCQVQILIQPSVHSDQRGIQLRCWRVIVSFSVWASIRHSHNGIGKGQPCAPVAGASSEKDWELAPFCAPDWPVDSTALQQREG